MSKIQYIRIQEEIDTLEHICNMTHYGREILVDIYEAGNMDYYPTLCVFLAMLALAND